MISINEECNTSMIWDWKESHVREVCIIEFAHILSLWDNFEIAAPPPPPLSQLCKKYANVFGQIFRLFFSMFFVFIKSEK